MGALGVVEEHPGVGGFGEIERQRRERGLVGERSAEIERRGAEASEGPRHRQRRGLVAVAQRDPHRARDTLRKPTVHRGRDEGGLADARLALDDRHGAADERGLEGAHLARASDEERRRIREALEEGEGQRDPWTRRPSPIFTASRISG